MVRIKIGSWEWLLSPMLLSIPTSKWEETIFHTGDSIFGQALPSSVQTYCQTYIIVIIKIGSWKVPCKEAYPQASGKKLFLIN